MFSKLWIYTYTLCNMKRYTHISVRICLPVQVSTSSITLLSRLLFCVWFVSGRLGPGLLRNYDIAQATMHTEKCHSGNVRKIYCGINLSVYNCRLISLVTMNPIVNEWLVLIVAHFVIWNYDNDWISVIWKIYFLICMNIDSSYHCCRYKCQRTASSLV